MKPMKQCAALLLALVLVFSMTVTVSAAENGTITINGATKEKVYELYRIFDLTMAGETAVAYTINEKWEAFFAEGGAGAGYIVDSGEGLNPITVNKESKFINITDSNVEEFSRLAQVYAVGLTADASQTATTDTLVFSGLPLGYYLVYPQGATDILEEDGCICSLTSTVPEAEVNVKATYPSITKTDDAVSADLGQTVNYTITGKVPDTTGFTTYEYTVQDTMSSGLSFNQDVAVTFGGVEIAAAVDYTTISNGFIVTFDMAGYQDYAGEEIVITYSAVVNENAVVKDKVEKNKAILIYSSDPKDSEKKTETPPIEEEVYTSQIVIDKVDGTDNSVKLAGAEFILKNEQGQFYHLENNVVTWVAEADATPVTTDETGAASFDGLKDGTYYLVETKAPDGYNLLTEPVPVDVNKDGASKVSVSVVSEVANNSGTTLPETGGMGTTVFYTLGGALVLGACVLLITKKRMGAV